MIKERSHSVSPSPWCGWCWLDVGEVGGGTEGGGGREVPGMMRCQGWAGNSGESCDGVFSSKGMCMLEL